MKKKNFINGVKYFYRSNLYVGFKYLFITIYGRYRTQIYIEIHTADTGVKRCRSNYRFVHFKTLYNSCIGIIGSRLRGIARSDSYNMVHILIENRKINNLSASALLHEKNDR